MSERRDDVDQLRTFSIGSVLSRGLGVYGRHIVPFTLLSVLIYVPVIVWVLLLLQGVVSLSRTNVIVATALTVLMAEIVKAVLFHATIQDLRRQPVSLSQSIGAVVPRIFTIIGISIATIIGVVIGSFCFIIPGLIVMTMLWVATPVAIIEKRGMMDSLSRSWELVLGHGFQVFGAILIFWVIDNVPELLFSASAADPWVAFIVPLVIGVFVPPANACVTAVGYRELRTSKEGIELEAIAAEFD